MATYNFKKPYEPDLRAKYEGETFLAAKNLLKARGYTFDEHPIDQAKMFKKGDFYASKDGKKFLFEVEYKGPWKLSGKL